MLEFEFEFERPGFHLQASATFAAGATGVCGPSGCGKSTLLALLAGLLRPARGRLRFDGQTLVDTASGVFVPAWHRHFALVFQDGLLFPHLTVRDNLLYGQRRRAPAERSVELDPVLELLEIGPLQSRRPAQLSGGERQRVALGRALLSSPRLLLLDEPLASLDERLKAQILPYLRRVRDETRVPLVYVSHVASEVEYVARHIVRMDLGTLPA